MIVCKLVTGLPYVQFLIFHFILTVFAGDCPFWTGGFFVIGQDVAAQHFSAIRTMDLSEIAYFAVVLRRLIV